MNPLLLLLHAVAEPLGAAFHELGNHGGVQLHCSPMSPMLSQLRRLREARVAILAADFKLESEMLAQKLRLRAVMRRPCEM